jgi:hypothetical protein
MRSGEANAEQLTMSGSRDGAFEEEMYKNFNEGEIEPRESLEQDADASGVGGSPTLPIKIMSTILPISLLNSYSHVSSVRDALRWRHEAQSQPRVDENIDQRFREQIRNGSLYKALLDKGTPEVIAFRRQQLYYSTRRLNRFLPREPSDLEERPSSNTPNAA